MTNTDDADAGDPPSGRRPPAGAPDPLAGMVAAEARGLRVSIWIALVRSTKHGAKLYVDVVYLVDGDTVTIAREDEVRRATIAALHSLPFDVWANVELTADPALAE